MAEPTQYLFSYKEVAEILIKHQGIHEGLWCVYFKFGINAANASFNSNEFLPTAIVPVLEMGIQKTEKDNNLSVDAAIVNPMKPQKKSK